VPRPATGGEVARQMVTRFMSERLVQSLLVVNKAICSLDGTLQQSEMISAEETAATIDDEVRQLDVAYRRAKGVGE